MYSKDRLVILDADGTTIDAFAAIERTFQHHRMRIGDLQRFQKRHNLFKYLGGLKEFPTNLKQQLGKQKRSALIDTLTEIYTQEARLYPGMAGLINRLMAQSGIRVGLITRNITREPKSTLRALFKRHGVDVDGFDFFLHVPLQETKLDHFRKVQQQYRINPARACACGDEKKDYLAALATGMHPYMVSYGFEDFDRLIGKIGVPEVLISRSPEAFAGRLRHGLELD